METAFLRCFDTMSTISNSVCIQEIGIELISSLENSILSFIFGDFGGRVLPSSSKESNSRSLYQAQNLFRITKKSFKMIILSDLFH